MARKKASSCRKIYTGKKGGLYYIRNKRRVYVSSTDCVKTNAAAKRCVPPAQMGGLITGPKGGIYYMNSKGRRIYTSGAQCSIRGGASVGTVGTVIASPSSNLSKIQILKGNILDLQKERAMADQRSNSPSASLLAKQAQADQLQSQVRKMRQKELDNQRQLNEIARRKDELRVQRENAQARAQAQVIPPPAPVAPQQSFWSRLFYGPSGDDYQMY